MANRPQDLINLLIEKRNKLELTQNKLSKKLGVSHTTVARIESGSLSPTLTMFIKYANELGYDLKLQEFNQSSSIENSKELEEALILLFNQLGYQLIDNSNGVFDKDVLVLKRK